MAANWWFTLLSNGTSRLKKALTCWDWDEKVSERSRRTIAFTSVLISCERRLKETTTTGGFLFVSSELPARHPRELLILCLSFQRSLRRTTAGFTLMQLME